MGKVIIAVENLRIGGYQRLALDQAYYLSDVSQRCVLLLLNPEIPGLKSFEDTEKELIDSKNLAISRLSGKRVNDLFIIRKMLTTENANVLIISHSMRSTVLFSLARLGLRKKIVINTTIHQLPSMSAFVQRLKRFCYAQFGDNIFAYSDAVQKDWISRYSSLGKKITILRNGIYTGRLNFGSQNLEKGHPRLIFLGRNTSWKGIDTYLNLFKMPFFADYQGLMMIANASGAIRNAAELVGAGRIEIVEGANLENFEPRRNDLHVYPAQYGENAKFTEPISLNCLEMALLGIPSLVTKSNENTWPELSEMGVFIPVQWILLEENEVFIAKTVSNQSIFDHARVVQLVAISNNINVHLRFLD